VRFVRFARFVRFIAAPFAGPGDAPDVGGWIA
jgi:hypothetical protein